MSQGKLNLIVKIFANNEDGDVWHLYEGSNSVTSQKVGLLIFPTARRF